MLFKSVRPVSPVSIRRLPDGVSRRAEYPHSPRSPTLGVVTQLSTRTVNFISRKTTFSNMGCTFPRSTALRMGRG